MVSEIAVIKQMGKTAQMDTRDDRLTMLVVMLSSHYLYNYIIDLRKVYRMGLLNYIVALFLLFIELPYSFQHRVL